jgi:hypothetical protein
MEIYSFALFAIALAMGMAYGVAITKYNVFPHRQVKAALAAYRKVFIPPPPKKYGPFSIGIYQGETPFDLAEPRNLKNPILTARDVADIDALFVADPFILVRQGKWLMFFEALDRITNKGKIGYAESEDGIKWEYRKVIIDELFHLSYPHIFEWNGVKYMVPESYEDLSVRLYKATSFPETWEYVRNLLSGYRFVDPTLFRYNDMWWMFVSTTENNSLNLYFSAELESGWHPHPMNPVVKFDKHNSRPGGKVIFLGNKIFRMAQDCAPYYGIQVFAIEITSLTQHLYKEDLAAKRLVVTKSGQGWNASGMHHADLHHVQDKWFAAVDGQY